jgi:murein DD-endopeptidase MepM/ murein hydrolase activator NlpD
MLVVAAFALLTACSPNTGTSASPPAASATSPRSSATQRRVPPPPAPTTATHPPRDESRFFVKDKTYYRSPWFAGEHQIMIGFGCTAAPYYTHDPACPGNEGKHHGIDVAMRCGTKLYAGVAGTIAPKAGAGAPGPAYGPYAFRIRNASRGVDILIGHVLKVYVQPGDRVRKGELIARANHQGAPDGCHLHFEVRPAGGGFTTALNPRRLLGLAPSR